MNLSPAVAPTAKRILVAEDDPDMRALVVDELKRDGHHVDAVKTGAELLIWLSRTYRKVENGGVLPPDLIVSDVRMPVMSGLEIVRGMRNAHWDTPVILMTAFGDAKTRAEAAEVGAMLIDKPLRLAHLRAEVRRLLAR
jgi:DNA-binding response OmpR family regulator